jgi:hypothetical protein
MELSHDREARSLKLTQKKLTGELISRYGLADARARLVSLAAGEKFRKEGEPLDTVRFPYSECVGSLLYMSMCTRPNIAQAMGGAGVLYGNTNNGALRGRAWSNVLSRGDCRLRPNLWGEK